jgi:hypothetical protein
MTSISSLNAQITASEQSTNMQLNLHGIIFPLGSSYSGGNYYSGNLGAGSAESYPLTKLTGTSLSSINTLYGNFTAETGSVVVPNNYACITDGVSPSGCQDVTIYTMMAVAGNLNSYMLKVASIGAQNSNQSQCEPFTNYVSTAIINIVGDNYTYSTWSKT